MKVRTQQNFNQKTHETVFGISIMPDGGRRYCKYPIGHQEYKDYAQAHQAMKDVQKILDNGGRLVYSPKGSAGINKHEYVKIEMSETKIILDACCGSRMFWFDKENPLILFADIRDEEHTLCDGRSLKVHPDIVSDFTDMPFLDKSFKLVVFDPPHLLKVGQNSWLAKKYGKLPEDWPRVIKKGIDECFRVLEDYGVLIFKWNEEQITVREVLKAIGRQPLFGHTTGRHGKTMWMCFMKLPIYE